MNSGRETIEIGGGISYRCTLEFPIAGHMLIILCRFAAAGVMEQVLRLAVPGPWNAFGGTIFSKGADIATEKENES